MGPGGSQQSGRAIALESKKVSKGTGYKFSELIILDLYETVMSPLLGTQRTLAFVVSSLGVQWKRPGEDSSADTSQRSRRISLDLYSLYRS